MFVPVLRHPGLSLVPFDAEAWSQLLLLESQLGEAAVALELFLANPIKRPTREERAAQMDNSRRVREAAAAGLQRGPWSRPVLDAGIPVAAWEAAWASAGHPPGFNLRVVLLHAHAFMFALDGIARGLKQLRDRPGVAQILADYRAALPDLGGVRDSAHHDDQRIRGLDRHGNPITPNGLAGVAPPGLVLISSSLVGDALTYTIEDGTQGQVRVSADTLKVAQAAVQKALDAFTWQGPPRISPV